MRALRGLYLVVGVLIGVLPPFVTVILSLRGFSPLAIGLVMALTAVGYVVGLPAWGHLGDVVLGRRGALMIAALGAAVTALLFGAPLPLPLVALFVVAFYVAAPGTAMLTDAIAVVALASHPDRYGSFRLLESGSFAVAALAAGVLFDATGYGLAYPLAAAAAVLVAIAAIGIPDVARTRLADYRDPTPGQGAGGTGPGAAARSARQRRWTEATGSIGVAIGVAPRLLGVMAAVVLANLGVVASLTFLPLRIADLGGAPSIIALSATVSALFEMPAMMVAARVGARVGLRGLFVVGCGLYVLAYVAWIVLADPTLIVVTRPLTGLAYGSLTVTSVLTVGALLPEGLQASGQALYQMSALGVAAILSDLGGGYLFGTYGHGPVFAASAVAAVLAAIVAWRYVPSRGEVRLGPSRAAGTLAAEEEPGCACGAAGSPARPTR